MNNLAQPRNGVRYNYLSYMRVSKDDEVTGSHTFQTQELRIREALDRRHGSGNYALELLKDDGVSGSPGLRPTPLERRTRRTLQVIEEKIATRRYDGLVIYSQSRLFRNLRGMLEFVEDVLLKHDTALISATENLDIYTLDGRLMVHFKAMVDGLYRDTVVQRNRDAAATATQQGYFIGQVSYGWDWEPVETKQPGRRRGIVPIPEQRQWILHMKDRFLSGWGCPKIAGELNALGVAPPSHHPRWSRKADLTSQARWAAPEVYRILASPNHAGLVKSRQGLIQGRHGVHRFWDPEVREQIVTLHEQRMARFKTVTGKANNVHLLAGLIHCARCGRRLYVSSAGSSAKGYRTYRCSNGHAQGHPTCPNLTVRAVWVEEAVVQELHTLATLPEMRDAIEQQLAVALSQEEEQLRQEQTQLKQTLAGLEVRFERWADAFTGGVLTAAKFEQYQGKLVAEQSASERRLREIEHLLGHRQEQQARMAQLRQTLEDFPLVWEHLNPDERRQVLLLLLEKLTADRQDRLIRLRLKVHLLPEREVVIPYRSFRGRVACASDPVQQLTRRQLSVLYYLSQGKTQTEIAHLLKLTPGSLYTYAKVIRKKMGGRSLPEIIDLARERIAETLPYLPLAPADKPAFGDGQGDDRAYLSGVLMEVLPHFAAGATVAEVAAVTNLAPGTVQGRKARILQILGVATIFEAVQKARSLGILV